MDSFLRQYLGDWEDEIGNRLIVRRRNDVTVFVTFLSGVSGEPIPRPWCDDRPTVDMPGHYRLDEALSVEVELCERRRGFILDLTFEPAYSLDSKGRDALVPALGRFEEDNDLDQYYGVFDPLTHYTKITD